MVNANIINPTIATPKIISMVGMFLLLDLLFFIGFSTLNFYSKDIIIQYLCFGR